MSSTREARVAIVLGPAQLLFLSASLRQAGQDRDDFLILAGKDISPERKAIMEDIAQRVWPWQGTVWGDDIVSNNAPKTLTGCLKAARCLADRVGARNVREVWLCQPLGPEESSLMLAYPAADIVVSDEGLGGYLHIRMQDILRHPSIIRKWARLALRRYIALLRFERKLLPGPLSIVSIKRRYLLLPELVPSSGHGIEAINKVHLKSAMATCAIASPVLPGTIGPGQKRILILGQYLSHSGNRLTWKEELGYYADVCRELSPKGEIYWKEHPKNPRPFYKHLVVWFPALRDFDAEFVKGYPVEITLGRSDFKVCVAATSTALFTLQRLTDLRSYSFVDRILSRLVGSDREVANLILAHVPSVREVTCD